MFRLPGRRRAGTSLTNAPAGNVVVSTSVATRPSTPSTSQSAAATNMASITATARNAQNNSIAVVGNAVASTGSPVSTSQETMVPLPAFAHYEPGHTALAINHQGLFVATTISFNLAVGASLGQAVEEIERAIKEINMPSTLRGSLTGTAQLFAESSRTQPLLIMAAIIAVYIVLGILYESYIHPITILSTLPSAGVGAVLALMLFHTEFSIIAFIGVILLIGIVKKNAILMIDFAIEARRARNASSYDAIYEACVLRFRPIMMTTMAAILGALPLALQFRQWRRSAPSARHRHRRRADRQPGADALHDAGRLPLSGQLRRMGRAALARAARAHLRRSAKERAAAGRRDARGSLKDGERIAQQGRAFRTLPWRRHGDDESRLPLT